MVMRKFIALIVFIMLCVTGTYAQNIHYGIKVGMTNPILRFKTYGSYESELKSYQGYQFGGVAQLPLRWGFSVQSELLYNQLGGKYDDLNYHYKMRFNYLQLPVNLVFKIGKGNFRPMAMAGGYIGYAINGTRIQTYQSSDITDNATTDITFGSARGDYKRFDAGVGAGIGVEIHKLQFLVKYNRGLTNNRTPSDMYIVQNRFWEYSLTYFFK
jgi:hypothetical protein